LSLKLTGAGYSMMVSFAGMLVTSLHAHFKVCASYRKVKFCEFKCKTGTTWCKGNYFKVLN